jgi:catechol 2,3-dioxygenase-like lactoylglutathione lyase family enzyme
VASRGRTAPALDGIALVSVRAFLHAKLDVTDMERALAFYCGLLGCREIVSYPIPAGRIVQVSPTGRSPGVELWYEAPASPVPALGIHVAFAVDDTRVLVERLRAAGVAIAKEPFEIEDEVIAFVRDPDGYLVELNEKRSGHL